MSGKVIIQYYAHKPYQYASGTMSGQWERFSCVPSKSLTTKQHILLLLSLHTDMIGGFYSTDWCSSSSLVTFPLAAVILHFPSPPPSFRLLRTPLEVVHRAARSKELCAYRRTLQRQDTARGTRLSTWPESDKENHTKRVHLYHVSHNRWVLYRRITITTYFLLFIGKQSITVSVFPE